MQFVLAAHTQKNKINDLNKAKDGREESGICCCEIFMLHAMWYNI